MKVTDFPGCCGITVLYDMNYATANEMKNEAISTDAVSVGTRKQVEDGEADAMALEVGGHYYMMSLADVNQKKELAAAKKAGFKQIAHFQNGTEGYSTGNMITVLGKFVKDKTY